MDRKGAAKVKPKLLTSLGLLDAFMRGVLDRMHNDLLIFPLIELAKNLGKSQPEIPVPAEREATT